MLGSTLAGVELDGEEPNPGSQPEEEVVEQRNLRSDLAHCIVAEEHPPRRGCRPTR